MTTRWGLLTNHALVLLHLVENPRSTLREIAGAVGVTDRAALSIVRMIEEDQIIARRKEGRRNVYTVDVDALLAHRTYGKYSIDYIASLLIALSGVVPEVQFPDGMLVTGGSRPTVAERLRSDANGSTKG